MSNRMFSLSPCSVTESVAQKQGTANKNYYTPHCSMANFIDWKSVPHTFDSKDVSSFLSKIKAAAVETIEKSFDEVHSVDWSGKEGVIQLVSITWDTTDDTEEEGMFVIILPAPIPLLNLNPRLQATKHLLVVTDTDIHHLELWRRSMSRRMAIVGNPGISKSWHLWKAIVFAVQPALLTEIKAARSSSQISPSYNPRVIVYYDGPTIVFFMDMVMLGPFPFC